MSKGWIAGIDYLIVLLVLFWIVKRGRKCSNIEIVGCVAFLYVVQFVVIFLLRGK